MENRIVSCSRRILLCLTVLSLSSSVGCIQFAANLLNVVRGPEVPAQVKGFENKLVAVICSNEQGICRDETTIRLAGDLKGILASKLPKTKFVNQEEIKQWIEGSSVSESDILAIGDGVKADYVIAVDILKLQLKDGPTLFRGRSDLSLTVLDVKTKKPIFRKAMPEYAYPVMAGQSTTETDERKFRGVYLTNVASKLSRYFYPHEFGEDVAMDATISRY
jgi:hypothetical protein